MGQSLAWNFHLPQSWAKKKKKNTIRANGSTTKKINRGKRWRRVWGRFRQGSLGGLLGGGRNREKQSDGKKQARDQGRAGQEEGQQAPGPGAGNGLGDLRATCRIGGDRVDGDEL